MVMCRMNAGGDQTCNPAVRAVIGVAPDDQRQAGERDEREQCAIAVAEPRDQRRARVAERHENMGAEKNDQPEDEDCEAHATLSRDGCIADG